MTVGWGCNLFVGDFEAVAGAGGGGGSATTATGGGGGVGGADLDRLSEQGLIVRYYLDEAADGQGPNTALDAAPEPLLPLAIEYSVNDTNPVYVTDGGHRGLRFDTIDSEGKVLTAVNDVKVDVALEGQTGATIELVTKVEQADDVDESRLLWIGANNELGRFALNAVSTNEVRFRWQPNSQLVGTWTADLTERVVLHLVLDSTRATPRERVRLFRNGSEITNTSTTVPDQSQVIALGANKVLALGNAQGGSRNLVGNVYYAALYDRPLSPPEIAIHTDILTASDDTPP